jgi:hypothetical protein
MDRADLADSEYGRLMQARHSLDRRVERLMEWERLDDRTVAAQPAQPDDRP